MSSRTSVRSNKGFVAKQNITSLNYNDGKHIPKQARAVHNTRMSNSDMIEIKHGQVFLLEYGSGSMKRKRMLVKLHDNVKEGDHRVGISVLLENTNGDNWSTKNNDKLGQLINEKYKTFDPVSILKAKNHKFYYEHAYPNMETTDVKLLENIVSNKDKFNLTFMPIETIMGNNLNMRKKEEYKKALDDLMGQYGKEIYISRDLWEHIMQFLVGDLNYKKNIRDGRTHGGKRTRSAKKNRLTKYKH